MLRVNNRHVYICSGDQYVCCPIITLNLGIFLSFGHFIITWTNMLIALVIHRTRSGMKPWGFFFLTNNTWNHVWKVRGFFFLLYGVDGLKVQNTDHLCPFETKRIFVNVKLMSILITIWKQVHNDIGHPYTCSLCTYLTTLQTSLHVCITT